MKLKGLKMISRNLGPSLRRALIIQWIVRQWYRLNKVLEIIWTTLGLKETGNIKRLISIKTIKKKIWISRWEKLMNESASSKLLTMTKSTRLFFKKEKTLSIITTKFLSSINKQGQIHRQIQINTTNLRETEDNKGHLVQINRL